MSGSRILHRHARSSQIGDPNHIAIPVGTEAQGTKGLVTSPHVFASIEGQRVLSAGGNAIEAAIAMGPVLAVVYLHFNGVGGDAVWLVADAEGRSEPFLGIGRRQATVRVTRRHTGTQRQVRHHHGVPRG